MPLVIYRLSHGCFLMDIFLLLSECANTEQLGRQVLRNIIFFLFSSWFDFSSGQIRTRDGWMQSENATAVLCRPPPPFLMEMEPRSSRQVSNALPSEHLTFKDGCNSAAVWTQSPGFNSVRSSSFAFTSSKSSEIQAHSPTIKCYSIRPEAGWEKIYSIDHMDPTPAAENWPMSFVRKIWLRALDRSIFGRIKRFSVFCAIPESKKKNGVYAKLEQLNLFLSYPTQ